MLLTVRLLSLPPFFFTSLRFNTVTFTSTVSSTSMIIILIATVSL